MKIQLTRGFQTDIDTEDWPLVSSYRWVACQSGGGHWYARSMTIKDGKKTWVHMHRLISQAPAGMLVDHIDGDSLNNSRANLRCCTHAQNMQNAVRPLPSTGVRNVKFLPKSGRYCGKVTANKIVHQKNFITLQEAADWVAQMRVSLHEGFAVDNRLSFSLSRAEAQ